MDAHDKFPEERIGTVAMMRNRSDELEAMASACDIEAEEQRAAAGRLAARSTLLRQQAEEYRVGALAIEREGFEHTAPSLLEGFLFAFADINADAVAKAAVDAFGPLLNAASQSRPKRPKPR